MTISTFVPATERQAAFTYRLLKEREVPKEDADRMAQKIAAGMVSKEQASDGIKWLLTRPLRPGMVKDRIEAMPKASQRETTNEERVSRDAIPITNRQEAEAYIAQVGHIPSRTEPLPTFGIFRYEGEVYVIVASKRNPGKHYAKKLVETPQRLTSSGEVVNFDYVNAPGIIWLLHEEHRMPVADIEAMTIKHSVCIYPNCGRKLKAARSVAMAMGRVHARKLGLIK